MKTVTDIIEYISTKITSKTRYIKNEDLDLIKDELSKYSKRK